MTYRDTTVQCAPLHVNRRDYVTGSELAGRVLESLQVLVELGVAPELATVLDVSEGTVYRHARTSGAKGRPKKMDPMTFRAVCDLFQELGILDGADYPSLRAASNEIRRRAEIIERVGVAAVDGRKEIE